MPDTLKSAFRHLSTALEPAGPFEPYAYQIAVADALLAGRRVVLRAPSGAGKTLAAWFPWLTSRMQSFDFPPKMLHVLPGGTFFSNLDHQLQLFRSQVGNIHIGVQTEGDAFDPFLLADADITTVDQLLSVALHRPLGLHPDLANINAGALLGAYLCFDEFPALASRDTLVLWLGLLRQFYAHTPCLFTSSVLPKALMARIAEALDAEYLDESALDVGGRRRWLSHYGLSAEAILRQHGQRTIIVCNTVRGAQMLYRSLRRALALSGRRTELLLLHQYQFYRDRRPIEDSATNIFGSGGSGNAILVTTSGIKTAADLSADTLITDPAAPDILLRRAGRCARFAGESGRVIVARVSEQVPGETYPAPPHSALLDRLTGCGEVSFADELHALDEVWETALPVDVPDVVRELPQDDEIDAAPLRVIGGEESFPARLFPRVGVCVHRVPETVSDPFELERFSVAVSSLERGWKQWLASGCTGEWFALVPHWPTIGAHTPSWSLVEDPQEFRAAARLIVLNAEAVSYDPIIGLELSAGVAYQSERLVAQHTTWSPFDQHMQLYPEHAARALAALEQLAPWHRYVLRYLGARWQIPVVELEQWMRLCILWHDAGKLTADWQRAANRWQNESVRRPIHDGVVARVDYFYRRDGAFPCPDHAVASGQVLARAFALLLGARTNLLKGTIAALGHHHGIAPAKEIDLTPHPDGWPTLMDLAAPLLDERQLRRLDRAGWTLNVRGLPEVPSRPPDEPDAWMAYSLLVRAIRLADREVALADVIA